MVDYIDDAHARLDDLHRRVKDVGQMLSAPDRERVGECPRCGVGLDMLRGYICSHPRCPVSTPKAPGTK